MISLSSTGSCGSPLLDINRTVLYDGSYWIVRAEWETGRDLAHFTRSHAVCHATGRHKWKWYTVRYTVCITVCYVTVCVTLRSLACSPRWCSSSGLTSYESNSMRFYEKTLAGALSAHVHRVYTRTRSFSLSNPRLCFELFTSRCEQTLSSKPRQANFVQQASSSKLRLTMSSSLGVTWSL